MRALLAFVLLSSCATAPVSVPLASPHKPQIAGVLSTVEDQYLWTNAEQDGIHYAATGKEQRAVLVMGGPGMDPRPCGGVMSAVSNHGFLPVVEAGFDDQFGPYGAVVALLDARGLTFLVAAEDLEFIVCDGTFRLTGEPMHRLRTLATAVLAPATGLEI